MKMTSRIVLAALAGLATMAFVAIWSSSARYGSTVIDGYELNNDVWGTNKPNTQTISANSGTNWWVVSKQPNTNGVKSYPHNGKTLNVPLNNLHSIVGTVNLTTPSGGAWETAYDLWDTTYTDETMVWLNSTGTPTGGGNVKPISFNYDANGNAVPVLTNVSIGGHTWNVFRGNFGTNCTTFIRTSYTNSATVDLLALLRFAQSNGYIGNQTVGSLQFGFEITSTNGVSKTFTANDSTLTWN